MPRGYMEGPAAEEAEQAADEAARRTKHNHEKKQGFPAVYGCTDDDPEPHFIGWRNEVDPDELFKSGKAWGVTVRRVAATTS